MKIIDALLGEHGVFYAQFDHLERTVPTVEILNQVQAQAALMMAALTSHARLEDEALFVRLEPHLGPMGPLAMMRMEHDEMEGALSRAQDVQALAEAQAFVLHAVQVARQHFAKEEQVLFPTANRVLGREALADLGQRWAERRGVRIVS